MLSGCSLKDELSENTWLGRSWGESSRRTIVTLLQDPVTGLHTMAILPPLRGRWQLLNQPCPTPTILFYGFVAQDVLLPSLENVCDVLVRGLSHAVLVTRPYVSLMGTDSFMP
jgi:hypothetical protein